MQSRFKRSSMLLLILFLQLTFYVTIVANIPVARQILGFIYLTFVPGFVIVKLLKLDEKLDNLEVILFSVGLSIAFLMIVGLLVNELACLFGIHNPLSLSLLFTVFNALILAGGVAAYSINSGVEKFKVRLPFYVLPLICLPILSITGAIMVNSSGENSILLLMLITIALVVTIGTIKKTLSPQFYAVAVFVIALSLLYHTSLISNYIVGFGSDVTREYYIFKNTQNIMYWNSTNPYPRNLQNGRIHAMLSVTILPTVYSNLLNLDPTWLFKILFPLIFSFVPLGLYKLYKNHIGEKRAFLSVFLFMSYETFYTEMLGLNRQIVGELFLTLLMFLILTEKVRGPSRVICFTLFSFCLITSHYGLAEICLFFIFFAFLLLSIFKYRSRTITISVIALFFVLMFSWYIYTANLAVFNSILEYGEYVRDQLKDFFNPRSRGSTVLRGLGLESPPTIWNTISRLFAYLTESFIVVGFIDLIVRRRGSIKKEFLVLTTIAITLLAALILVPGLANTMNMTRFYHILLFILSPLCVIGAEALCHFMFRNKAKICSFALLLSVLIAYFLFQTSFVYEIVKSDSWSLPLSKYRMNSLELSIKFGYMFDVDVFGAKWLTKNMETENLKVYADVRSRNTALFAYGLITKEDVTLLSNVTQITKDGVVFLNNINILQKLIVGNRFIWNTTEFSFLEDMSKIYSNGASEIYRNH
ncbi:MAG: DUF2206 domain-containing protein [Candidatus Baldrarchaeia archaeon]